MTNAANEQQSKTTPAIYGVSGETGGLAQLPAKKRGCRPRPARGAALRRRERLQTRARRRSRRGCRRKKGSKEPHVAPACDGGYACCRAGTAVGCGSSRVLEQHFRRAVNTPLGWMWWSAPARVARVSWVSWTRSCSRNATEKKKKKKEHHVSRHVAPVHKAFCLCLSGNCFFFFFLIQTQLRRAQWEAVPLAN